MPETTTRPPDASIPRDFTLFGSLTKAWTAKVKAADGVTEVDAMYLSGVASSSVRDRQGDTITAKCQAMMLEQLQAGVGRDGHPLAMFLNHEYRVPEDVLGDCRESRLTAAAPADGEDAVIDLEIVCRVTGENPRAVMAWKIVNDGVSLGFSVGGSLTEYEVDDENDDGESWCPPLLIDGMALWEISLCGIPANPRAYTETLKTASAGDREKKLAAAHKFMRDLGLDDEAPEPSNQWARDIRRRLVRVATRSQEVRAKVREVLDKQHADAVGGEEPKQITMRVALAPDTLDAVAREAIAKTLGEVTMRLGDTVYALALAEPTVERAAGEAPCAHGEGCEAKNAAGSEFCEAHAKDVGDSSSVGPDVKVQSGVAAAIGCLTDAMNHGMCKDAMDCCEQAHKSLIDLLDPENDDETDDDAELAAAVATIKTLSEAQRKALLAAAEAIAKDGTLAVITGSADLDESLAAKRAELEKVSADAQARVAEADAAQATLAKAVAEHAEVAAKIEELKKTPTGRMTAPPGSAVGREADTRTAFQKSDQEIREELVTARRGAEAENPAQRPA